MKLCSRVGSLPLEAIYLSLTLSHCYFVIAYSIPYSHSGLGTLHSPTFLALRAQETSQPYLASTAAPPGMTDTPSSASSAADSRMDPYHLRDSDYARRYDATRKAYDELREAYHVITVDPETTKRVIGSISLPSHFSEYSGQNDPSDRMRKGDLAGLDRIRASVQYNLNKWGASTQDKVLGIGSQVVDDQRRIHRDYHPSTYSTCGRCERSDR